MQILPAAEPLLMTQSALPLLDEALCEHRLSQIQPETGRIARSRSINVG
jgi:hypothetical protein